MGFTNSVHDPCLFYKLRGNEICIVGIYVDDIIIACNENMLTKFKVKFAQGFRLKHLGPLS